MKCALLACFCLACFAVFSPRMNVHICRSRERWKGEGGRESSREWKEKNGGTEQGREREGHWRQCGEMPIPRVRERKDVCVLPLLA